MQEMTNKVDITHTVSLKNRPHPDARLIRDLDTGEANWEGDEPVPEGYFDGPPNPPLGYNVEADVLIEPVNPAPKPRAKKRLLHG